MASGAEAALLSQRDAVHRDYDNKCYLVDHHLEILGTDNGLWDRKTGNRKRGRMGKNVRAPG